MSLLRRILALLHIRPLRANTLPPTHTPPPPFLFRVLHSGSPTVPATTTFDAIDSSLLPRNASAAATLTTAHAHLGRQRAPTPFLSICEWESAKRYVGWLKAGGASEIFVLGFEVGRFAGVELGGQGNGMGMGGGGGRLFFVGELGFVDGAGGGVSRGGSSANGGRKGKGGSFRKASRANGNAVGGGNAAFGGFHEGEWLLLGGYKASEKALVMNLAGFDEVKGPDISLEELSNHVAAMTKSGPKRDSEGIARHLYAIMTASADASAGRQLRVHLRGG